MASFCNWNARSTIQPSYTADEIWQYMPGERSDSVLLATWYEGLFPQAEDAVLSNSDWEMLMAVREMKHGRLCGASSQAISFSGVLAIFDNIQIETTQIHGTKMMHFLVNYMELVLIIGFYGIVL
jgi:isoleucyl-tRNA synthetase